MPFASLTRNAHPIHVSASGTLCCSALSLLRRLRLGPSGTPLGRTVRFGLAARLIGLDLLAYSEHCCGPEFRNDQANSSHRFRRMFGHHSGEDGLKKKVESKLQSSLLSKVTSRGYSSQLFGLLDRQRHDTCSGKVQISKRGIGAKAGIA
jgi:hypothetical protein